MLKLKTVFVFSMEIVVHGPGFLLKVFNKIQWSAVPMSTSHFEPTRGTDVVSLLVLISLCIAIYYLLINLWLDQNSHIRIRKKSVSKDLVL